MDIQLISPRFNPTDLSNKTLSIQSLPDGFCFCIRNRAAKEDILALYLKNYQNSPAYTLDRILEELPHLAAPELQTEFCVPESLSTLIPFDLFDPRSIKIFGKKALGNITEAEDYHTDILQEIKAVHLHVRPLLLTNQLKEKFPALQTYHPLSPWIRHLLRKSRQSKETLISVNLSSTHACLAIHSGEKFTYFNHFAIDHPDSLLYYLLAVAKNLDILSQKPRLEIYCQRPEPPDLTVFSDYFCAFLIEPSFPEYLRVISLNPFLHLFKIYP